MNGEGGFPELLATRRLELRPYVDSDAAALLTLIEHNRAQLRRSFAPLAKGVVQTCDARTFVIDSADNWIARKEFVYGIWSKPAMELIGQIKVKNIVWNIPAAELSYFISRSAQRRGFATEAVGATLHAAFGRMQFKRIYLRIIPSNHESLLLAQKLGFRPEGLHRKEFRCGFDELHDVHHYAFTDEDPLPSV
jgi:RimJ/RimL family protein N-acetyltransferase